MAPGMFSRSGRDRSNSIASRSSATGASQTQQPHSADARGWTLGRRTSILVPAATATGSQPPHLQRHQDHRSAYQHQGQSPQGQRNEYQETTNETNGPRISRETFYCPSFSASFVSASDLQTPISAGFPQPVGFGGPAMHSTPSFDAFGSTRDEDDRSTLDQHGRGRPHPGGHRLQARTSVYERQNPHELADFLRTEPPSMERDPGRSLNHKASARSMRNSGEAPKAKKKGFFGKLLNVGGGLRRQSSNVDLGALASASSASPYASTPMIDPLRAFPKSAPAAGHDNAFSHQQYQAHQSPGNGKHKYPPAAASAMANKQSSASGLPPSCRNSVGAESQRTTKRSGSITSISRKPVPDLTDEEKALLQELEINPPKPSNEPFRPRPGFRSRTTSDPNLSQAQTGGAASSEAGGASRGAWNPSLSQGTAPGGHNGASASQQRAPEPQQLVETDATALREAMQAAQERRGVGKLTSRLMRPSTAGGRLGGQGNGSAQALSGQRQTNGRSQGQHRTDTSRDSAHEDAKAKPSLWLRPGSEDDRNGGKGLTTSPQTLAPPSNSTIPTSLSTPDLTTMVGRTSNDSGAAASDISRQGTSADEGDRTSCSRSPGGLKRRSTTLPRRRSLRRPPSQHGRSPGSPQVRDDPSPGRPLSGAMPTAATDKGAETSGDTRPSLDNVGLPTPPASGPTVESGLQVTFDMADDSMAQCTPPATADADKVRHSSGRAEPPNGMSSDHVPQSPTAASGPPDVSGARTHSAAQLWVAYLEAKRKAQQATEALEAERARCRQLIQRCMTMLELQRRLSAQSSHSGSRESLTGLPGGADSERRSSDASSSAPSVSTRATTAVALAASRRMAHEEEKLAALVDDLRAYVTEPRWETSYDHHNPRSNLTSTTLAAASSAAAASQAAAATATTTSTSSSSSPNPVTRPLALAATKGRDRVRPLFNGHGGLAAPSVPGTLSSHLRRPRTSDSAAQDRAFAEWKGTRTVPMLGGPAANRRSAFIHAP